MKYYLIIYALVLFHGLAVAQLSKTERKISQSIDSFTPEILKLWEDAVNINSGTMNFDGVRKVGALFQKEFDALGFTTRWVDGRSFGRAGHLIAEHKGKAQGRTVLLIGHLDTVFELSSPFQKFSQVNDSTVQGPGSGDMKGGDVIMIQSLKALQKAGVLDEMNIIVIMTGDEEHSGDPLSASKHDLIEAARRADIAIGFEDGDGKFESAIVSRRSSSDWKLTVNGTPAHSSQIFTDDVGAGAIFESSRILNEFYSTLSIEQDLTFNPGVILGGTTVEHDADMKSGNASGKDNIVAKDVVVTGDIRAISPAQLKKAQEVMRNIVEKHLPQTKAEIAFGEGYPPLAPTEGNYKLLELYGDVSMDVGYGKVSAVKPRNAGAADISFTSGFVDMALDGLGPRCSGGHTVNETADPRTIPMEARRVAILLHRLLAERAINKK